VLAFFFITMKSYIPIFLLILFLTACNDAVYKFPQADIQYSVTKLKIHRYGKTLFELETNNFQNELKSIQDEFRLFLDADLNDSVNVMQLSGYVTDTQLVSIYRKSMEVYPDLIKVETLLSDAFSRYHHFFPNTALPDVYTYISDLYYEMPVWKNDSAMVIALDIYLGKDFPLYNKLGLPYYKVRCMTPENLPVDVMKTIYFEDVATNYKKRTLLDHMIESGKILTFLDAILPGVPDSVKICYSSKKLEWAIKNEKNIWGFLIGNDLLFSTDYQSQTRLIQDGPFTNGFSNDSPSRLGVFIGWQIVNQYMNRNPEVTLDQMLKMTDSQMILQKSAYKP